MHHVMAILMPVLCLAAEVSPPDGDDAQVLKTLSARFPHRVFADDFNDHADGEYPDGWEALTILLHRKAQVENKAFKILTGQNIHMIQPLDGLDDFMLKYRVCGHHLQRNKLFCTMPCLRMGRDHTGYFVFHQYGRYPASLAKLWRCTAGAATWRTTLHDLASNVGTRFSVPNTATTVKLPAAEKIKRAGRDVFDTTVFHDVIVVAEGERVYVFHDGLLVGRFADKERRYRKGLVGFTLAGSGTAQPGPMIVDDVEVFARKPIKPTLVSRTQGIEIPFKYNRLHGGPMRFDVSVSRYGRAYVLHGRVSGGACNLGFPHVAINPYVMLQTADGRHSTRLYLFRGKVGNTTLDRRVPPAPYGYGDTSGPQANQCYFDYDPGRYRIAVGYEHYTISPGTPLSGPCQIVVEPTTGKVLHGGIPLHDGAVLTMASPADKQTLRRVPKGNPFHKGFREFLADNHFFVEGEPIRFTADLLLARPDPSTQYTVRLTVRDAFKGKAMAQSTRVLEPDPGDTARWRRSLGLHNFTSGWFTLDARPPGVYHLDLVATDAAGTVVDRRIKAFSVLPREVDLEHTPAERSGLPTLFGAAQYPFQPAYQADAYHYSSSSVAPMRRADSLAVMHALNKKTFLTHPNLADDAHLKLIAQHARHMYGLRHVGLPKEFRPINSPRIYSPHGRSVKVFLQEFLKSPRYKPVAGHALDVNTPVDKLANADYLKLHTTVKQHYWKAFTRHVAERKRDLIGKARALVRRVAPGLKVFTYAYPFPCNVDYMTPYGGMNSAGWDLRSSGWVADILNVEGYFDECRYADDREWACWAVMKMLRPEARYSRDAEGYVSCLVDGNNAHGWPPFGVMNVGPGFFKKAAMANVYKPVFFKAGAFHWAWDNAYRLGYFPPDRVDELLAAFRVAHHVKPKQPVPTVGYVYAQDWVAKHPERLDPALYPYNTADESIVFAYEEGSRAGVLNGFFVDPADLAKLDSTQVRTLVLPPLDHADKATLKRLRELHAQGVSLVASEAVPGLEDLFGVKVLPKSLPVDAVRIADNDVARRTFFDLKQTRLNPNGHVREVSYGLAGGVALLDCTDKTGRVVGPALVLNRGPQASTLFWTVPPTDLSRTRNHVGSRMRGECDSELIRAGMGRGLRLVADTPVTTTAGHLIAFRDTRDRLVVMVYENAFPFPSKPIHPMVDVRMKGIGAWRLATDKAHHVGVRKPDRLTLDFGLVEDEVAVFVLEPGR